MQNKPIVIIAAISSRPYVKAAVEAGYDVIAIDAFLDRDTQAMAKQSFYVPCVDGQFQAQSMLEVISLVLSRYGQDALIGFSYGAGFEAQPELITNIHQHVSLLGNQATSIRHAKDPILFEQFCYAHGFKTPEITVEPPLSLDGWLIKTRGASGGRHIDFAKNHSGVQPPNRYYQKFHSGVPVSCLFLATESGVRVVGVNEQWLAEDIDCFFQYGGAASHYQLPVKAQKELERFIRLGAAHFRLKGLNSVDALLEGEQLTFLEINPRLSATVDLYATQQSSLFALHVAAFQAQAVALPKLHQQSRAHHIVYAKQRTHTHAHDTWPDWVCDIPNQAQIVDVGMPICTVVSIADTVQAAKQLALARAASLKQ